MTGVFIERGNLDTDRHRGKILSEHEGRDQGDASKKPRNADDCQQTGRSLE